MAGAGKIVLTDSGKRGVRTTGKTAVFNSNGQCAECCDNPCLDCTQTPGQAVVSVAGCIGVCKTEMEGTYQFGYYYDFSDSCLWQWYKTGGVARILELFYCRIPGIWCAKLYETIQGGLNYKIGFGDWSSQCGGCEYRYGTDVSKLVACDGSSFTGNFTLDGADRSAEPGGLNCIDCIATVTI